MKNIYTVAQVNAYIRNMFAQDFLLNELRIKGEIGNCKYHTSGHIYFTLKDSGGSIAGVMFAGKRSGLNFKLCEGQQVVVNGRIDVYERDGKYQLYAEEITLDGEGELYARLERLKRELEEMGMFAQEYKRPIPKYVRTLGVVTAPTGAAVRDIINIAKRRNPGIQIILYPAVVQGEAASASIVNGIHALERLGVDVMIVGRGGGSLEDLWAFNEREVAQAVFDCSIPVISAVGHETDTTLIDYVADLRAPTPSAAAELAVFELDNCLEELAELHKLLEQRMKRGLERKRLRLENLLLHIQQTSPANQIEQQRGRLRTMEERLAERMKRKTDGRRHQLELYIKMLKGLSPLDKLSQGYAYVCGENGRTIRSVTSVSPGERITVHVKDGKVMAAVTDTEYLDR